MSRDDRTARQVLEDMGDGILAESTPGFDAAVSFADVLSAAARAGLAYALSKLTPAGKEILGDSGVSAHAGGTSASFWLRFMIPDSRPGGGSFRVTLDGEVGMIQDYRSMSLGARVATYPSNTMHARGPTLKEAFDKFLAKDARKFYPGLFQG